MPPAAMPQQALAWVWLVERLVGRDQGNYQICHPPALFALGQGVPFVAICLPLWRSERGQEDWRGKRK